MDDYKLNYTILNKLRNPDREPGGSYPSHGVEARVKRLAEAFANLGLFLVKKGIATETEVLDLVSGLSGWDD